jgi:hypothetical protein
VLNKVRICRLEDQCFQILASERRKKKSNKRSNDELLYGSAGSQVSKQVKKRSIIEQALSLGGDLNFSDDEEDDASSAEVDTDVVSLM